MSYVTHLECATCGSPYAHAQEQHLCHCGGPLLVRYDLDALASQLDREALRHCSDRSLWRYGSLLPVSCADNVVSLGEGGTPLLAVPRMGAALGIDQLYIKDEGTNPTGTFKARGAALGVSMAKELGIRHIAMPTAGNAGGAWAAYCARARIKLTVVMPADAPDINKAECRTYGADTYLVNGLISDAGKIIAKGIETHGWYDASTLKEPYRIEGKKTMGLEIAEAFRWDLPDVILYPAGGGVGLIGIWKAFEELQTMGWIRGRIPKLVAVQAAGCNPLVQAFAAGAEASVFCEEVQTKASGLRVPKALGDFLVLRAVRETDGCAVDVTDCQMAVAMQTLAAEEGMLICPEGAALIAATEKLRHRGWLQQSDRVVLLNTGSGLKYPEWLDATLPTVEIGQTL